MIWGVAPVWAASLADRVNQFPQWQTQPSLKPAQGNLVYPDWFLGNWHVTSTLVALAAPLAPDIVSPGFANQTQTLNQPVEFEVRFSPEPLPIDHPYRLGPRTWHKNQAVGVIADQAYNSLNLATAYLGSGVVKSVTVDPHQPTRQVMRLQGDRLLTLTISDRGIERHAPDQVITSEVSQQVFHSPTQVYLNQVENTTAYQWVPSHPPRIEATQITAIYLSPQDPAYFQARNQPIALYQYHLILTLQNR